MKSFITTIAVSTVDETVSHYLVTVRTFKESIRKNWHLLVNFMATCITSIWVLASEISREWLICAAKIFAKSKTIPHTFASETFFSPFLFHLQSIKCIQSLHGYSLKLVITLWWGGFSVTQIIIYCNRTRHHRSFMCTSAPVTSARTNPASWAIFFFSFSIFALWKNHIQYSYAQISFWSNLW